MRTPPRDSSGGYPLPSEKPTYTGNEAMQIRAALRDEAEDCTSAAAALQRVVTSARRVLPLIKNDMVRDRREKVIASYEADINALRSYARTARETARYMEAAI